MALQRALTKATRELGEVRITVCRSTLASDSGEMDRARFLLSFSIERGVEYLEPEVSDQILTLLLSSSRL